MADKKAFTLQYRVNAFITNSFIVKPSSLSSDCQKTYFGHKKQGVWGAERPVDVCLAPTEAKRRRATPHFNPQGRLCLSEENSEFQGFSRRNKLFIPLFHQVENLFST